VLIPPKYQAVTKILVKRERVDPVVTSQRSDPMQVKEDVGEEELNSEIELIESDDVLRQTVIAKWLAAPQVDAVVPGIRPSEDEQISKAVMRLKADLHVDLLKKSTIISLTYTSSNPKFAVKVLETLSNAYIDKHLAVHRPAGQVKSSSRKPSAIIAIWKRRRASSRRLPASREAWLRNWRGT